MIQKSVLTGLMLLRTQSFKAPPKRSAKLAHAGAIIYHAHV